MSNFGNEFRIEGRKCMFFVFEKRIPQNMMWKRAFVYTCDGMTPLASFFPSKIQGHALFERYTVWMVIKF